jgi:hypothetical protein
VKYAYRCPTEMMEFEVDGPPADTVQCRCGDQARRIRSFAVNKGSLKSQGRWDPVVGQWVDNDRQFREVLKAGQEREAAELGMDVKLATVDARDHEALGELHGTGVDHRKELAEQTARVKHDERVTANHEQKPKALIV